MLKDLRECGNIHKKIKQKIKQQIKPGIKIIDLVHFIENNIKKEVNYSDENPLHFQKFKTRKLLFKNKNNDYIGNDKN